jgi:phage shock protein A
LGLTNRVTTLLKQKVNVLLNKFENPKEALDYSYTKQIELLNHLRRNIAEVITAKKRLEMQKIKLMDNSRTLDEQATRSVESGRDDLARLALERKNANVTQLQQLAKQIDDMQVEQDKLEQTEKRLSTKVEEFRSKKEVIKAQYTAAEAQVRIKESITGITEEMADVGMALNNAEDKTEQMKAKSQALDEMLESGTLTDYTSSSDKGSDEIERELEKASSKDSVEEELAKLKAENRRKRKVRQQSSDESDEQKEENQTEEEIEVSS